MACWLNLKHALWEKTHTWNLVSSMAVVVIIYKVEFTTSTLLNGHIVKLPSKIYVYAHRYRLLSTTLKEGSLCTWN